MEKGKARSELGVGWEEAVLAFGAEGGSADRRKGYDILQAALERLHLYHEGPVRLLVFGGEKKTGMIASYPVIFLGHLNTDYALRCAYCAADVFVCPSRDDNLPNTIVESLACGTPVAAFAVGGIPDMVQDNVNGCLATPHDPEELARCIASILKDKERHRHMATAARQRVLDLFSPSVVARQHQELYEEVLERRRGT